MALWNLISGPGQPKVETKLHGGRRPCLADCPGPFPAFPHEFHRILVTPNQTVVLDSEDPMGDGAAQRREGLERKPESKGLRMLAIHSMRDPGSGKDECDGTRHPGRRCRLLGIPKERVGRDG